MTLTICQVNGCPQIAVRNGRCGMHASQHERQMEQGRETSAQRGYGYAWQRLRARFLRDNPTCWECGEAATDVDHIIPRSQGGTDDERNLRPLCHRHHSQRTAREQGFGRR